MRVLQRVVCAFSLAVCCLLTIVGVVALPLAALLVWGFLGTFAGSVVWSTLRSRSDGSDQRASGRYQAVTAAAAGTVVSCLVIVGLVAVFGTAVGPLLLLCLLGCAVRLARQLRERFGVLLNRNGFTATRSTAATVVEHQMVTLNELPTEALCRAWRRSYSRLQQATALPVREQLVLERERMLDELQRRDQEGFARWLDSGARAGGDPSRYLASDRR